MKYKVKWCFEVEVEAANEDDAIDTATNEREDAFEELGFDAFDLYTEVVK